MCQMQNQTVNSSLLDSSSVKMTLKNKIQDVFYNVVDVKCFGLPQKKGLSPVIQKNKIKDVESVFCVSQCAFILHAESVPSAVQTLAVRGRLQNVWRKWSSLGANPRVTSILKEGYTLPFKMRPPLTRSPVVRRGYANPVKNRHLKEALLALMQKLVVEKVVVRSSLAFYNRLFLVPKPNK